VVADICTPALAKTPIGNARGGVPTTAAINLQSILPAKTERHRQETCVPIVHPVEVSKLFMNFLLFMMAIPRPLEFTSRSTKYPSFDV
jgi:hypothetical protein